MKGLPILLISFILTINQTIAQVSINNDGSQPDPSAGLDVNFSNKGFLPPRMTITQRDAIVTPAEGLMVICTDCGYSNPAVLSIYINGSWRLLSGYCSNPVSPPAGAHIASTTSITWNWNLVNGAIGYKWGTTNNIAQAVDMGLATTKSETELTCNTSYARYVWAYNDCGFSSSTILSSSTTLNPPFSPIAGVHVAGVTQITWNWNPVTGASGYKWNTSDDSLAAQNLGTNTSKTETGLICQTSYTRYIWAYGPCGTSPVTILSQQTLSDPPAAPLTGTHVPNRTKIIWNWNPVSGATGYKWSTDNDYSTAIDLGSLTSKTETGLTCNTGYTRYVWAYGTCGVSTSTALNQTTSTCLICGEPITDSRDNKLYNTVLIGSRCWMALNLNIGTRVNGSQEQTNNQVIEKYCYDDLESNCDVYGGLYQWNEMMQYVTTAGTQGICPEGWHLPTDGEWTELTNYLGGEGVAGGKMKEAGTAHWLSPNTGATNSSGFTAFPGGYRGSDGDFYYLTNYAYFWSSAEYITTNAWYRHLHYNIENVSRYSSNKTNGFSCRCLEDN